MHHNKKLLLSLCINVRSKSVLIDGKLLGHFANTMMVIPSKIEELQQTADETCRRYLAGMMGLEYTSAIRNKMCYMGFYTELCPVSAALDLNNVS